MKRFGLLILVAVFVSALSIGTFNPFNFKSTTNETAEITTGKTQFQVQERLSTTGEITSSEEVDTREDVYPTFEGFYEPVDFDFFVGYHQQAYLTAYLTVFDNHPFSRIFRSTV